MATVRFSSVTLRAFKSNLDMFWRTESLAIESPDGDGQTRTSWSMKHLPGNNV